MPIEDRYKNRCSQSPMDKTESVLRKIERIAAASFKNAVRLHEDAILLFKNDRIPSALQMSALSIEEIGKYFMFEDVWWQNRTGGIWSIEDMQQFLRGGYSHTSKQSWFAGHVDSSFVSKQLIRILQTGELENIKQKATYVGMPRKGKNINFDKRLTSPKQTSRRRVEDFITMVNDYIIELAVGTRKGFYSLDISEIYDWLAELETERHFLELWPLMGKTTKKRLEEMRKHNDIER
jgi:AbiV family abortive infection protein